VVVVPVFNAMGHIESALTWTLRYMPSFSTAVISCSDAEAFRRAYALHPGLVLDEWDVCAEHIGFFYDDELVASLRVVHAGCRGLPITAHLPSLPVSLPAIQIGRLVANRSRGYRTMVPYAYMATSRYLFTRPGLVYIPALEQGPISISRYLRDCFVDTGLCYTDNRYPLPLRVLVRTNVQHEAPWACDARLPLNTRIHSINVESPVVEAIPE
jgi:hypothetical protein